MDVKDAIRVAKRHVADLFGDEEIFNLGLEEVERDEFGEGGWKVTLGFSRPWNRVRKPFESLAGAPSLPDRSYKVVLVKDNGEVSSVRLREVSS